MEFEIRPDAQGDNFIFHYTSADGLAAILDSGKLRFSDLSRLNDPRERQPISFGFSGVVAPNHEETMRLHGVFDRVLRQSAYLACFTGENDGRSDDGYYTRGWAPSPQLGPVCR